jgi:hypothetical protein
MKVKRSTLNRYIWQLEAAIKSGSEERDRIFKRLFCSSPKTFMKARKAVLDKHSKEMTDQEVAELSDKP